MAIGDFLIIDDQLQQADVIHVISGLDYRTDYGIELYKKGYAKYIFFTGGWCAEIQGVHAERGKQRSIDQGISEEAIKIDPFQVTSTYQEAQRLKLWVDQFDEPVQSIIIVSDPWHMRRARWTYQQVFGKKMKLIMAPIPFDRTPFQENWWSDDPSRAMVRDEYIKIVYYYARYKLAWGPIKDWLASFDTD